MFRRRGGGWADGERKCKQKAFPSVVNDVKSANISYDTFVRCFRKKHTDIVRKSLLILDVLYNSMTLRKQKDGTARNCTAKPFSLFQTVPCPVLVQFSLGKYVMNAVYDARRIKNILETVFFFFLPLGRTTFECTSKETN